MKLEDLVGEEVSSVAFVRDYVEIHFDGPILRLLQTVTVRANDRSVVWPDAGSRDMLCELIGRTVRSIASSDTSISIAFPDGFEVVTVQAADQGEFAHFVPGIDKPIKVW